MGEYSLIDCHFHAGPDVLPRAFTIREAGELYRQLNGWVVVKSHLGSTAASAYRARQEGLPVSGTLVLNRLDGGVAPHRVEQAVLAHGGFGPARLIVSLPTRDGSPGAGRHGVRVFDDVGLPLDATLEVLRSVRDTDSVVASGHLTRAESLRLIDAALDVGVQRILLTHALHPMSGFGLVELFALAALDQVWVETTLLSLRLQRVACADATALLTNYPRAVLSSDLGQSEHPGPAEAWRCAQRGMARDAFLFERVTLTAPQDLLFSGGTKSSRPGLSSI
ncbi:DUF6282 family protein [Mycetocola saprophilus]|uniref:DUF6282 family protein n=1 Tax=Mycetocola saprophilus TaxID=76636 RepID=UPI003BEF9F67